LNIHEIKLSREAREMMKIEFIIWKENKLGKYNPDV
jgi:hypothetical protein